MFEEIKYFIQRGRRGYSDRDLWGFCDYLCDIIPPALRKLSNKSFGCPSDFYDSKAKNDECHKWKKAIEEMAQGFEAAKEISGSMGCKYEKKIKNGAFTYEYDKKQAKQLTQKYQKGMELFVKYFLNLWD